MGRSYKIEKDIAILTNTGSFSYRDVEAHEVTFEVFREEQAARIWLGEDPNVKY